MHSLSPTDSKYRVKVAGHHSGRRGHFWTGMRPKSTQAAPLRGFQEAFQRSLRLFRLAEGL
jgi:hypothetical protein